MATYRDMLAARVERAKRTSDPFRKDIGPNGRPPSASPTTFADCADLYWHAAVAYGTAAALYQLENHVAGDAWYGVGQVLEQAATSCDASASGEIIEV